MKPFKYLPGALRTLLLANAAVFIIAFLGRGLEVDLGAGYGSLTDYISYFGAFMPRVPLELWRYVTYMFIHFDFMHFFFNMLMLWMFGSEVAEWMGSRHFVAMYFFCGIFAALFSFCKFGRHDCAFCSLGRSCRGIHLHGDLPERTEGSLPFAAFGYFPPVFEKSRKV